MRFIKREYLLKYNPLLISLFFLSAIVVSAPLYLSKETISEIGKTSEKSTQTQSPTEKSKSDNSVKVNIDNSVKGTTDDNTNQPGTCKVTRNGVTEIVPADKVDINENSSGDINVKAECDNSSSTTNGNGSNKTSIKNSIQIEANSQ